MKIKFKKLHELAVLPSYSKPGDAGLDITTIAAPDVNYLYMEYKTGLSVEIPQGYVGLLFPRSSISKTSLSLTNSVGVIDSGYRGEICFRFKQDRHSPVIYNMGDRIGQLIILPFPRIECIEANELSDSERGTGGFGSTNK